MRRQFLEEKTSDQVFLHKFSQLKINGEQKIFLIISIPPSNSKIFLQPIQDQKYLNKNLIYFLGKRIKINYFFVNRGFSLPKVKMGLGNGFKLRYQTKSDCVMPIRHTIRVRTIAAQTANIRFVIGFRL